MSQEQINTLDQLEKALTHIDQHEAAAKKAYEAGQSGVARKPAALGNN